MSEKLCVNLHHVSILVKDVEEAFHRYEMLLGLHGEIESGIGIMRCMHEDFCLILKPAGDNKPFLDYVAYELNPGLSLADAEKEITKRGESVETIDVPRRGKGLKLNDPDGNAVVLVERIKSEDSRPARDDRNSDIAGLSPPTFGSCQLYNRRLSTCL